MIGCQRKNGKPVEVNSITNNWCMIDLRLATEDMFGADDDDWAIYRKIVIMLLWLRTSTS
jgi:hypothetical protein